MSPDHPLRRLGAILAVGPVAADRAAALTAPDLDWPRLVQVAGQHLVTPSLANALRRHRLLDGLPVEIRDYLDGMRDLNRLRNRELRAALIDIARALNLLGIEPLLLKGANALLADDYPGAADRVIGDLDLGVPPGREAVAVSALRDLGYRPPPVTGAAGPLLPWEGRPVSHHHPPLLHPTRPVKVELHRRLLYNRRDDARLQVDLTATPHRLASGAVVRVPDAGTRLLHNFLHAQINDRLRRLRCLNLRQLLDFAALAQRHPEALTPALLARLRPRRRRAFLEYLAQAEDWLGLAYPPALPRAWSARRELWLQERVLTRAGWRRLFVLLDAAARLPPRLARLPLRLILTPGWLPWRLRLWRAERSPQTGMVPPALDQVGQGGVKPGRESRGSAARRGLPGV